MARSGRSRSGRYGMSSVANEAPSGSYNVVILVASGREWSERDTKLAARVLALEILRKVWSNGATVADGHMKAEIIPSKPRRS